MFPLSTKEFPASADQLTEALNASLERIFVLTAPPVSVRGGEYPAIDQLSISLDGARVRANLTKPVVARDETTPALRVQEFTISGRGVSFAGATADLRVEAKEVRLHSGRSASGDLVLGLQKAIDGRVQVATTKSALEAVIAQLAKQEAGKHGVTIDGVRLKLTTSGARSFAAEVHLRARKLFLSASIRVAGQVDLDEELHAKISGLRCEGEGAMASVACGVLNPHLQKLDGRVFPLMALPLGEIRLRDVRLAVGDEIEVTAEFGAAV